jgi:hypothetical protein
VRAAQKLLGVPTFGGGSDGAKGGGGGSQRSQIRSQATRNVRKRQKNGQFPALIDLKIAKMPFYTLNYFTRYTSETFFEEYMKFS